MGNLYVDEKLVLGTLWNVQQPTSTSQGVLGQVTQPKSLATMVEVTLHNTLGAQQVGVLTGVFLFGVVTIQFHHYVDTFEEDKRSFRIMVSCPCLTLLPAI